MAIARALRAAGKQMTATGRPVRLIRPVRKKSRAEKDPALPVRAPQGQEIWDTPNIKMAVGMAVAVVLAKLTMMEFAEVQASLKPLTEEQREEIQELRPRTPFESKIGRSHARIRTGEALSLEDIKDWATDVLVETMMRKEETVQRSLQS